MKAKEDTSCGYRHPLAAAAATAGPPRILLLLPIKTKRTEDVTAPLSILFCLSAALDRVLGSVFPPAMPFLPHQTSSPTAELKYGRSLVSLKLDWIHDTQRNATDARDFDN